MKRCPSCGRRYRKGQLVYMASDDRRLVSKTVCATCASAATRILVEPPVTVDARTKVEAAECIVCETARATHCLGCALRTAARLGSEAQS